MAKILPLGSEATARAYRAVGMLAFEDQVFVAGSYSSTVATGEPEICPPIAYNLPFVEPASPKNERAVGMLARTVQASVPGS